MASTSESVATLVFVGLVGALIAFTLRAWVVMLALGVISVNASWGQSFLATVLLSFVFGNTKVEARS